MKVWFDDDDELPHRKQKPAIVRALPFTKMSREKFIQVFRISKKRHLELNLELI